MAFTKRYPNRRRRFWRRRPKQSFNTRVRRVVANTKESKSTQVASWSGTSVTTTTLNYLCNDIDSGDTKASRDGEQVYIRAIGGRFTIGFNVTSSIVAQVVRVVLYRPRQLNNLLSSLNYDQYIDPSEQIVLWDRLFTVNSENPIKICNLGYKFYNRRIPDGMVSTYSSGTGTDIESNPVYLAIVSDAVTNSPTINGQVRCFFKEK